MSSRSTQIIGGPEREDAHVDGTNHAVVTQGEIHYNIHRGIMYSTVWVNEALAALGVEDILVRVVTPIHLRIIAAVTATMKVDLFKDTTFTVAGADTLVTSNRNLFSANVSDLLTTVGPTITLPGTQIGWALIPAGSKAAASGATVGSFEEWVLPVGNYLIRTTNPSNQIEGYSMLLDYYISSQAA